MADSSIDEQRARRRAQRIRFAAGYAISTILATVLLRRMGYGVGGATTVRCRSGHHFTTWWIPGVSVKAVRLGWWRFQRCPVGPHWSLVSPVRAAGLPRAEARRARARHDLRLP